MKHDEFLQVLRSPFHFSTCDAVLRGCKIVDISKPLQWRRLSKKVRSPLGPSAKGLRPQAVGERTVRLPEIFRVMARFSPSAPAGHRSPSGASATSPPVSGESVSQREAFRQPEPRRGRAGDFGGGISQLAFPRGGRWPRPRPRPDEGRVCRILPVNGVQWQILPSSAACGRQLQSPR